MITFEQVSKTYPGAEGPAVADFSHTVDKGTTTVFVGPSGCGKTTLLRMVNRMVEPTTGAVYVRGVNVHETDAVELRRSIGYVMQHSGLMPHRRVIDNIADVASLAGASKQQARIRAQELLELVNLDLSLAHRYPAELSGGQAQRVGVARGLVNNPDILIMDEPFGAVDPVVRRDLQQEVLAVSEQLHATILLVTHDIGEAFLLGDEVVILGNHATVEQADTPANIIAHPANEAVREFTGANSRELHIERYGDETLAVDAIGNIKGVVR